MWLPGTKVYSQSSVGCAERSKVWYFWFEQEVQDAGSRGGTHLVRGMGGGDLRVPCWHDKELEPQPRGRGDHCRVFKQYRETWLDLPFWIPHSGGQLEGSVPEIGGDFKRWRGLKQNLGLEK